ncbi:hypothetical protein [Algivirga pacifica]|uniref:KxDL domain-containing protein n=1 Tax=Algivirga pacifica TaxID=1162670 RepID=A0ABP9D5J4_9BACT
MTTSIQQFAVKNSPSSTDEAFFKLNSLQHKLITLQRSLFQEINFCLSVDFQHNYKGINRKLLEMKEECQRLLAQLSQKQNVKDLFTQTAYLEFSITHEEERIKAFMNEYGC